MHVVAGNLAGGSVSCTRLGPPVLSPLSRIIAGNGQRWRRRLRIARQPHAFRKRRDQQGCADSSDGACPDPGRRSALAGTESRAEHQQNEQRKSQWQAQPWQEEPEIQADFSQGPGKGCQQQPQIQPESQYPTPPDQDRHQQGDYPCRKVVKRSTQGGQPGASGCHPAPRQQQRQ